MAISTIVSLVVNILFVLLLGLGFLLGLKRGVKRAGLRIGLFFVFVIIGAVVSPYITEAILNIKFTLPNGMRNTIIYYLESLFRQDQTMSNILTYNASLSSTLRQSIILVCNFAVFIVVALIMSFVSWIVYIILAKYVIRDKKRKETIEEIKRNTTNTFDLTPKPEKKYRLLGSLVGLVQGFVLAFILFMPISGLCATAQDILDTSSSQTQATVVVTTAQVEGGESDEQDDTLPATLGDYIKNNVPEEIVGAISAYRKTAIGAISSVGDLDKLCFDTITTIKVRGQKITLRNELSNICNMYEKIVYLYEFDFDNNDLSTLDFEIVDSLVDSLFSSNLFYAVIDDIVPYALNEYVVKNDNVKFGDYTGIIKGNDGSYSGTGLNKIVASLNALDNASSEIEQDFREIYAVAKLLISSGIADDVLDGDISATKILDTITAPSENGTILTQTINHLMKTNTLKIAMNTGFNVGLKALDNKFSTDIGITKYNEEIWGTAEEDIQACVQNLSSSYTYFAALDKTTKDTILELEFNKDMTSALKNVDLNKLILPIARALDDINAAEIFNQNPDGKEAENKPIVDRIIESIYESDMFKNAKKYVKLTVANNSDFTFEQSIGDLVGVMQKLIDKDCLDLIFDDSLDIKALFEKFDETKTPNALTFDETFGVVIDSELFRPSFVSVINLMNSKLCDIFETNIKTKELSLEADLVSQKQDIKLVWEDLLLIYDKIFDENGFELKDFDDADYQNLGALLEAMKTNVYDEEGETKQDAVFEGIYLNLIEYLKKDEEYGVYFTGYYLSYENPYEVDWHELLAAVRVANKLKDSDSSNITSGDLKTIVDIAGKSEDIENKVKDVVKDKLSDTSLKGQVDDLNLTDETTTNTIQDIADLANTLENTTNTDGKTKAINSFIISLSNEIGKAEGEEDKANKQKTIDTIVGIVDELANEEIKQNINGISESEKNEIKSTIEACDNLGDAKEKLKSLFGIETSETPEGSESESDTTPAPTPEPTPEPEPEPAPEPTPEE